MTSDKKRMDWRAVKRYGGRRAQQPSFTPLPPRNSTPLYVQYVKKVTRDKTPPTRLTGVPPATRHHRPASVVVGVHHIVGIGRPRLDWVLCI